MRDASVRVGPLVAAWLLSACAPKPLPNDPDAHVPLAATPEWHNWSGDLVYTPAGQGENYYFSPTRCRWHRRWRCRKTPSSSEPEHRARDGRRPDRHVQRFVGVCRWTFARLVHVCERQGRSLDELDDPELAADSGRGRLVVAEVGLVDVRRAKSRILVCEAAGPVLVPMEER